VPNKFESIDLTAKFQCASCARRWHPSTPTIFCNEIREDFMQQQWGTRQTRRTLLEKVCDAMRCHRRMRAQLMLVACQVLLAGALPAAQEPQCVRGLSPCAMPARAAGLRLRGGGLFFARKRVFVPRFQPPPAYSPPVPQDSAWNDVKVCLAAIARLVWRTVWWLCRLVARLLLRVLFAAASFLAGVAGLARRSTRPRPAMPPELPAGTDSLDYDWFGTSLGQGVSDATSVSVGDGFGSSREDAGKALQTPLQAREHTMPPQRCMVAEEVHDFSVDGEDRPARTQHHAAPSTDASRQRRCGVALPTQVWERRPEESLAAAQEQPPAAASSDTSSASHSLSALLQSDSAVSSGADRRAGQEGPAAMSAGKTRPAVRTPLGSQKVFMPSPFAAFAGQGTPGKAPGADGPITNLLTRTGGGLMRNSARHCAVPAAAAAGEEGSAQTEGVVAAGAESSMDGARRLRTALTRESDRVKAREQEKGMEAESEREQELY